jgi:glycosyltransferase involved in cell wall biosynthesis
LFSVWDPGRAYSLLGVKYVDQWWGYFPVDSTNVNDTLGGPAREAIERYTRVLAYGRWGSQVLTTIRRPVPYLPHGLDLSVWDYHRPEADFARAEEILQKREGEIVVGCVATNQPRKDFALFFGTIALLRARGHKVRAWLHTDTLVRAWSVQQLVHDFGLARKVTVSVHLTDEELAACYACCGATIAPGLGEGFGYPIVESLACGTPPVHGDFAGGAELVPMNAWRVPIHAERLEGIYALRRPIFLPQDMANAVERALDWKRQDERVCQAYCRGAVEYLDWKHLWPRWRSWFKQGLEAY